MDERSRIKKAEILYFTNILKKVTKKKEVCDFVICQPYLWPSWINFFMFSGALNSLTRNFQIGAMTYEDDRKFKKIYVFVKKFT